MGSMLRLMDFLCVVDELMIPFLPVRFVCHIWDTRTIHHTQSVHTVCVHGAPCLYLPRSNLHGISIFAFRLIFSSSYRFDTIVYSTVWCHRPKLRYLKVPKIRNIQRFFNFDTNDTFIWNVLFVYSMALFRYQAISVWISHFRAIIW